MSPSHYPCVVFFGPAEWADEGMEFGANGTLCLTQQRFSELTGWMNSVYYSVRAIAYFIEEPSTP